MNNTNGERERPGVRRALTSTSSSPGLENARLPFLPSQHKLLEFCCEKADRFCVSASFNYIRRPDVRQKKQKHKTCRPQDNKIKQFVLRR